MQSLPRSLIGPTDVLGAWNELLGVAGQLDVLLRQRRHRQFVTFAEARASMGRRTLSHAQLGALLRLVPELYRVEGQVLEDGWHVIIRWAGDGDGHHQRHWQDRADLLRASAIAALGGPDYVRWEPSVGKLVPTLLGVGGAAATGAVATGAVAPALPTLEMPPGGFIGEWNVDIAEKAAARRRSTLHVADLVSHIHSTRTTTTISPSPTIPSTSRHVRDALLQDRARGVEQGQAAGAQAAAALEASPPLSSGFSGLVARALARAGGEEERRERERREQRRRASVDEARSAGRRKVFLVLLSKFHEAHYAAIALSALVARLRDNAPVREAIARARALGAVPHEDDDDAVVHNWVRDVVARLPDAFSFAPSAAGQGTLLRCNAAARPADQDALRRLEK
jgi:hypothetical protein